MTEATTSDLIVLAIIPIMLLLIIATGIYLIVKIINSFFKVNKYK